MDSSAEIREKQHKSKPIQFVSVAGGVTRRCETSMKNRIKTRLSEMDKIRNIPRCENPAPMTEAQKILEHRRVQLEKWKEEKVKKKKEAALKKKKPFIVGIPHNTLKYAPPPPPKPMPSTSSKPRTPRKPLQTKNMVTLKNEPKSETSPEEKSRSPILKEIPMTPEQIAEAANKISPCVTLSRAKVDDRKEITQKLKEGVFDEDLCEIDRVKHFRGQLDSEISRMTEMCEAWEMISHQIVLSETLQESVLSAVGQTRLLMSQKLQQFASLMSRCEHPIPNTALVTASDLQGFWDMVYMQIEDIDVRFRYLEELRARGWNEDQPQVKPHRPVSKPARPVSKPACPAAAARPAAASRIKDIIAAARKAKQAQVSKEGPTEESKTIDMGFFHIQSPVKSFVQRTPNRHSLLKAVLSNKAEKSSNRMSASSAMLRASLIGRQVKSEESREEEYLIDVEKELQKLHLDCEISSTGIEKDVEEKRRDYESPVMTRSRRKTRESKTLTPGKEETERVSKKNTSEEVNNDIDTP